MAQRGIREYDAKRLMARYLGEYSKGEFTYPGKLVLVDPKTVVEVLPQEHPWLETEQLVAKPDQLFGKRAKMGLVAVDQTFDEIKAWIRSHMNQRVTLGSTDGTLRYFLVEPFVPHEGEHYVAIKSERHGDRIHFSMLGGIYIEENWDKVRNVLVPIDASIDDVDLDELLTDVPDEQRSMILDFVSALYRFYVAFGFTYLEINPFVISGHDVVPLDTVARLDDTEAFWQAKHWEGVEFPPAFGGTLTDEEAYITRLDGTTGASLKLTVLNPAGRVWTMIAGGGASVIYADTVVDLGHGTELANYGEYSGNPSTEETYLYAKTILDLMTRDPDARGKCLLIGGGIANFTDVAATFDGIVLALTEYAELLREHEIRILVRRGGPNYKVGLDRMRALGEEIGVPIEVYGPETHMTEICTMFLGEHRE